MQIEPESKPPPRVPLTPLQLGRMARGFSCLFWGIPLSVWLFSFAQEMVVADIWHFPAYVAGFVLLFIGLWFLKRAGLVTPRWRARTRDVFLAVLLLAYLAPVAQWWRELPDRPFFAFNALVFAIACFWLLILFNQLAVEVGRAFSDDIFRIEARLCQFSVAVLALLAAAGGAIWLWRSDAELQAWRDGFALQSAVPLPPGLAIVLLLPFTFTSAIMWSAKERCFAALCAPPTVEPLPPPISE